MIFLGLDPVTKDQEISRYCTAHGIEKVVLLSPAKFRFSCSFPEQEWIEWAEIIQYKFYYRLLQEINESTLVIVNECLRTQNRYDLTYNCIRHFLNQTRHQLVFQYLPQIDTFDDFMILFDFDTRSRWKREKFRPDLLAESRIVSNVMAPVFSEIKIAADAKTKDAYAKEKRKLIDGIGLKDPHTIPRNLYLMGGKTKLAHIRESEAYLGRNNRFKVARLQTYREPHYSSMPYTVFEFCHNFIDFADVLSPSRQREFDVLTTDLKVDEWYLARFRQWSERLSDAYTSLP